ncbi:signal peptidase II [Mycoplasma seminis]|uniref:Signal peptidase II n=1 Tax=Mycoplasma seminis TaxID=512749 RepID=A0ABY9HAH8_9MOLU|nr:signal peptidase II [Mycoplasma seminis]WLP85595.1 signal peptidase II [Mycoplasma seminis]
MTKIKTAFSSYSKYLKANWKKVLAAYLMLLTTFIIFFAIDQITKTLLFHHIDVNAMIKAGKSTGVIDGHQIGPETIYPNQSEWINYGLFGLRSIWHKGVTFMSTGNIAFIQAISFIISIIILLVPLYPGKHMLLYAALFGILLAGDIGNATDRIAFHGYVKDIFYVPWFDKGTFNFADCSVFVSVIAIMIVIITNLIIEYIKEKKEKTQKPMS